MWILNVIRSIWKNKQRSAELSRVDRDCTLKVLINDAKCELLVQDKGLQQVARLERLVPDNVLESKSPLLAAIEGLPPGLEDRIGNVEIFLDDSEISVIDSRRAKLTHFDGRTLAECGKSQLGGKPVCFASYRFGETSAQETEKRIVAYISEGRLTTVLFSLGKLARFTTFFGPRSLQKLLEVQTDDTCVQLVVHKHYSSLCLANYSAGAIVVRRLPVGTADLEAAYADMHGIDNDEARNNLASRPRLTFGKDWPPPADAPLVATGTHIALMPVLQELADAVNATTDYFEFDRLAGRSLALQLSVPGSRIAGFGNWLSTMLQICVCDADADTTSNANGQFRQSPALNFLEGMRTGLLKIGNQNYDFVGGHFVVSTSPSRGAAAISGAASMSKWKAASSQQVTLNSLKPFAAPFAVVVLFMLAVAGSYALVVTPMDQESESSLDLYSGVVSRLDVREAHSVSAGESSLWAHDLMMIAAAMPYDMKLERIALVSGPPSPSGTIEISGTLPRGGKDNLQLIGRFMTRLSVSPSLSQRFAGLNFAGADQADAKDSGDNARDSGETVFKIDGKIAAGPRS